MTQSGAVAKTRTRRKRDQIQASFRWWRKRGFETIFDTVHRVDTSTIVNADDLEILGPNREKGIAYTSCPWSILRRSLDLISLDPTGFTLVDMGCGKGKVLLSAMVMPFKHIVGVEFSRYLCRIAERNLTSGRLFKRKCPSVEVICADAAQYEIPTTSTIFFFNNPFNFDIMQIVLNNVIISYSIEPRSIFLIFHAASSMITAIKELLIRETNDLCIHRISTTLGLRSLYIFELPEPVYAPAVIPPEIG